MNILEVCVVPALGGLELYFHRCCLELRKLGHSVHSVRLEGSKLEELATRDGVSTHSLKKGSKIFPYRRAQALVRIIAQHNIDIVHAHHRNDLPLVALAKSMSKKPFKLVFTRQMPMKQAKKDPYHRWIYRKIDLFIAITELLKRDALAKLPVDADRIQRLYYGVAPPPLRDNVFLKDFLSISQEGDFNIGVFSRLEFQKGQHLVIDALKNLRERNIPAKLYIVGHVMYEDYKTSLLDQIKSHGLESAVVFKGFIPQPVFAMMGMDALILPSRNEAFGLVLIEAMRCGVPVLGVNAGGVPEIIDHNRTGLLFEWDNVAQLSDQLTFLYNDPKARHAMAVRGKEKADREFDSDEHFRKLEALFSRQSKSEK